MFLSSRKKKLFLAVISLLLIFFLAIILLKSKQERFVELLKVYTAYNKETQINLIRIGQDNDGGYVVPSMALEYSDALIGYGIAADASFEEKFSSIYKKPSFGFDCGVANFKSENKLFTFIDECIGNDKYLYKEQVSSNKISSYSDHLKKLNLMNKKIFIKMDIEGAEFEGIFDDILKHHDNITGIVLEIHMHSSPSSFDKGIKLLNKINEEFLLVHLHGNNSAKEPKLFMAKNLIGKLPKILELTFINKKIVTNYHLSNDQSYPREIDMPNDANIKKYIFEIL